MLICLIFDLRRAFLFYFFSCTPISSYGYYLWPKLVDHCINDWSLIYICPYPHDILYMHTHVYVYHEFTVGICWLLIYCVEQCEGDSGEIQEDECQCFTSRICYRTQCSSMDYCYCTHFTACIDHRYICIN